MENKTYTFQPEKKIMKQGSFLTDENGQTVYEAKMLKQPLFGSYEFLFINHITNKEEKHKVGHTVTSEISSNRYFDVFSTKSSFKFDGKNIWDYLHEEGIRIDTHASDGKLGLDYDITLKGQSMAAIKMGGKGIIGNRAIFNLITSEEYLDLAFLVAFAVARTEQAFLD